MRISTSYFSKNKVSLTLLTMLTIALMIACKKSDHNVDPRPIISYKQKVISVPVDAQMIPARPDSTGGPITQYTIQPNLPKGISIDKLNGVISGMASDTLTPSRFVVTATGPGGMCSDTLTIAIGTVGFNYGASGVFTFEKNATDLSTTPLSPVIVAGTFNQFFVSPSPDSLRIKTGLTFNSQTGQVSGTPSVLTSTTEVPTPVTFTITGITNNNKAASTTISFIINDKKPAFTYTFQGSFSVGTSVASNLVVTKLSTSGNIIKYRLAPGSPDLPTGLTLDSLTGKINGTPTAAANVSVVIRGLNTGGYQDVTIPIVVNSTAVAPQIRYMLSLFSGNVLDTIAPRIETGNTIYVTKQDSSFAGVNIFLNPVLTAGQANTYAIAPAFVTGVANENLSFSSGSISGMPGKFSTNSAPTHTITITNAASGGPAGSFAVNIVANSPFFTYNADGGPGASSSNIYLLVQGQAVNAASGNFPGYSANGLKPFGGAGVVKYTIYPLSSSAPAFSATGLNFDTTTGAISGTPTTNTNNFNNYNFWDYVILGQKADGSFTVYKLRFKIYRTTSEWGS